MPGLVEQTGFAALKPFSSRNGRWKTAIHQGDCESGLLFACTSKMRRKCEIGKIWEENARRKRHMVVNKTEEVFL